MGVVEQRLVTAPDGTELAYELIGPADGPALLLCDGIGCNGFIWKYIVETLCDRYRIVHAHYRGHGRSQIPGDLERLRIEDVCADLLAVLDAAGVDEAVALGHSMGVQVTLELGVRAPSRVRGLIPICGSFGRPLDTFRDTSVMRSVVPWVLRASSAFPSTGRKLWSGALRHPLAWYVAAITEVNAALARRDDFAPYLEHMARMSPVVFFEMLGHAGRHTAVHHLRELPQPALVVAGERDNFTPVWLSEKMARLISDSRLLIVPDGSHVAPLEVPELVSSEIEAFLESIGWTRAARAASTAAAAV